MITILSWFSVLVFPMKSMTISGFDHLGMRQFFKEKINPERSSQRVEEETVSWLSGLGLRFEEHGCLESLQNDRFQDGSNYIEAEKGPWCI